MLKIEFEKFLKNPGNRKFASCEALRSEFSKTLESRLQVLYDQHYSRWSDLVDGTERVADKEELGALMSLNNRQTPETNLEKSIKAIRVNWNEFRRKFNPQVSTWPDHDDGDR